MSWNAYTGPSLICAMALVGAMSFIRSPFDPVFDSAFSDGETQAALEKVFNESHVLKDFSVHAWSAFNLIVFNEGNVGVQVGRDGWLFSDEEFFLGPDFLDHKAENLDEIIAAHEFFDSLEVSLIIALLPDKARIMNEYVGFSRSDPLVERYSESLRQMSRHQIVAPDLRVVLDALREHEQVFLRHDTHWTPSGAAAVAEALAPLLREATSKRSTFLTTASDPQPYRGDLIAFLDTGPLRHMLGFSDELIEIPETSLIADGEDASLGLFGDEAIPGALVGTSFSALPEWNFLGALQQSSGVDFLSVAMAGQGPFLPMRRFIAEIEAGTLDLPEVVVWEIPERYMFRKDQ